jgi:hypothetical protein
MQTLTAGSFLNLEKTESIEALKFTAKRLAEMTTAIVPENLNAEALKNLANDLWQKAEYVARETERRRLHEIFNENFCAAFRELKPEAQAAAMPCLETQPEVSPARNVDSTEQSSATIESAPTSLLPKDFTTEAQGKKDEFLGFVNSGEPFAEAGATETNTATAAMQSATEKPEQETIQFASEDDPKEESVIGEKVSTENSGELKPQSAAAPAVETKNNSQPATSAVKTSATAPKPADAVKEPFEFGKCTVNLNLTLLPASGDGRGRRAIVSAVSHGSPPEIEILEIGEGENLIEIAALVKDKLERFRQTLPAKYIEQLRASKTKTAKKPTTTKPTAVSPAPTKPEVKPANIEKTSGEQKTQNGNGGEAEKSRTENVATKENLAAQQPAATVAVVPPVAAANNVQPSLF